ncbi:MAG: hypothetical protein R3343_08680 [Nitriliruptorales bacterium]|nr:hypothetical protein [Nitriliruptorales bacterium]
MLARRLAAASAALAVLVTACGDGEAPTGESSPSPSATVTPAGPTAPGTTASPSPSDTQRDVTASIVVSGGQVQGGVPKIEVAAGDEVRLEITSDKADEIHVHGYDVFADVGAGETVTVEFTADITGQFEIEFEGSHRKLADLVVGG